MKFRNALLAVCAGLLVLAVTDATSKPFKMVKVKATQETCLQAALEKLEGDIVKVEFKNERGAPIYEIEIAGKDRTMEFECDANTGKITEEETEVDSPDHPLFKSKAKVSIDEATRTALKAHPGKVVETEFEIEANGNASYEFDIQTDGGKEVKLEVDAATGKIIENDEDEIYQIGRE
jgi:uncharacterized membrane protein YkoI